MNRQKSFENDVFDALIERIRELNMDITKDGSLGSGITYSILKNLGLMVRVIK